MNNSMWISRASLPNIQNKIDTIADNMSNLNTQGYKRKDASFHELLTTLQNQTQDMQQPGRKGKPGFEQGWGVNIKNIHTDFSQGSLVETNVPTDFAIGGQGFFEIQLPNREYGYTRDGAFELKPYQDGMRLETKQGYPVLNDKREQIVFPKHAKITVSVQGEMIVDEKTSAGTLRVVAPLRSDTLHHKGNNIYGVNDGQMEEIDDQSSEVLQGRLEQSNVSMQEEMTQLMMSQRMYQLQTRILSSADQMLGLAIQLRQ